MRVDVREVAEVVVMRLGVIEPPDHLGLRARLVSRDGHDALAEAVIPVLLAGLELLLAGQPRGTTELILPVVRKFCGFAGAHIVGLHYPFAAERLVARSVVSVGGVRLSICTVEERGNLFWVFA